MQSVKEAKVSNYLVVAIDTPLRDQLEREGYNVYYRNVKVRLRHIRALAQHLCPTQGWFSVRLALVQVL